VTQTIATVSTDAVLYVLLISPSPPAVMPPSLAAAPLIHRRMFDGHHRDSAHASG
jgi:hypothetical protein